MDVSITQFTVADFCKALSQNEIRVNHDYQRSSQVWPKAARSFLIETILLGYPMPKLYLHQITDVKSKRTIKEIVDGQQRSMAILAFYSNELSMVSSALPSNAAGKKFEELDDELKQKFLDYSVTVDLFIGANKEEIREIFRRMNSYTVPLNAEEKRHSKYQGHFKWFIYRLTKKYAQTLEDMGVFTEKALNRMADAKLLAEFTHALLNGITTTNDKDLARLYEDHDAKFDEQADLERRIAGALDTVIDYRELFGGPLMKSYQLYALLLALAHARHPIQQLKSTYPMTSPVRLDRTRVVEDLGRLAAALDDPASAPRKLQAFVAAGESKTNVADQRKARFRWFCRALDHTLP